MADEPPANPPKTTLSKFFETKPANVEFSIPENLDELDEQLLSHSGSYNVRLPSIRLWCKTVDCQRVCVFQPNQVSITLLAKSHNNSVVEFVCCSCRESVKKYAFSYRHDPDSKRLIARKLGEDPAPSPHLPSRLRTLVGLDQERLDKGLRSEAHGLGVGAFAYYRQIVENQKDRLIDEILKVANLQNPIPELIKELEEAKKQNQFSTAVEKIKHAIPEILLIHGYNPLTLLHKALSEGLHAGSDEECLEIAHNIRVILSEFSERLATALKDDQELKNAVSAIANRSQK